MTHNNLYVTNVMLNTRNIANNNDFLKNTPIKSEDYSSIILVRVLYWDQNQKSGIIPALFVTDELYICV